MSLAAVKGFVSKIQTDKALRDEWEPQMKLPEEQRLPLAVTRGGQLGFDFTREEIREADQYRKFFEHVLADKKLRSELKAVTAQAPAQVVADTVTLARKNGFQFSEETMMALSDMPVNAEDELTDDDLTSATGGGCAGVDDGQAKIVEAVSVSARQKTSTSGWWSCRTGW